VDPSEIIVDPTTAPKAQLLVVAHNPSGGKITTSTLDLVAPPGLEAKAGNDPSLPATGDLSWPIEVTATNGSLPSPAKLVIELKYTFDTKPEPGIVATVATVTLPPPQALADAVKATLMPSEGDLDEFRPFELRLRIDNPTRRTVEIGQLKLLSPSSTYVELKGGTNASTITIPSGESASIPLTLAAKAAIPGTYTFLIGFDGRWLNPTSAWEPMTAQGKITIGIPGVTDALQFLGIPSLLLLPGALIILTFLTTLPPLTGRQPIDWKQPGLLLLVVLLSVAAGVFYPWATRHWLGVAHDYLRGYELRDVAYVWGGSMTVGLAAAFAVKIWDEVEKCIRWLRERYEPQTADQPIDILRKLQSHRANFELVTKRPANNNAAPWRLLLPIGQAEGREWLVRQGVIRHTNAAGGAERGNAVQRSLEAIDNAPPAAKAAANASLIKVIQAGLAGEQLTLAWDPPNAGPTLVGAADYAEDAALGRKTVGALRALSAHRAHMSPLTGDHRSFSRRSILPIHARPSGNHTASSSAKRRGSTTGSSRRGVRLDAMGPASRASRIIPGNRFRNRSATVASMANAPPPGGKRSRKRQPSGCPSGSPSQNSRPAAQTELNLWSSGPSTGLRPVRTKSIASTTSGARASMNTAW
jgi:hypothetical protein